MATISDLRTALVSPASCFTHIANLAWRGAEISRSTRFAETAVECRDTSYMLCMPLHPDALRRAERFIVKKRYFNFPIVPKIEILRNEMYCGSSALKPDYCDILLEPLPDGKPLDEAIREIADADEAAALLGALDTLQKRLAEANISLFNVRPENIVADAAGELRPVRWYYAAEGAGHDDRAFDDIRTKITELYPQTISVDARAASPLPDLSDGHFETHSLFEGLAAVYDPDGWGFVDKSNRAVIKPRFAWVNDFREGRAEVKTKRGRMGLIDKRGRYVIKPYYKIVEYDPVSGNSQVRKGRQWGVFDYTGRLVKEFSSATPKI